jgi:hypothetical protein
VADDHLDALLAAARLRVEDFDARYEAGELEVLPGQRPDAPVVRTSDTKRTVKGTGKWPGAKDGAVASRETAHKRTTTHRRVIERLVSLEDEDPDAVITVRELLEALKTAVVGGTETLKCHDCGEYGVYRRKIDAATGFKLLENVGGKAAQTIFQGIEEETREMLMLKREVAPRLFATTPGEAEERKRRAMEDGLVEEDWFEEGEFRELGPDDDA